jgi:2-polyprenyl-3-methyl-5-hydroxy-6-metoxy-1,4-benzoquinol methylase
MNKKEHPGLTGIIRYARLKKIMKYLKGSVLDVGCSDGALFTLYKDIEGIDIDKDLIKIAKKYGKAKLGSVEEIPYEDNSFDTVICLEVIEHIENEKKALEELARVSKKRIVLSFPMEPFSGHPDFMDHIPEIKGYKIIKRDYNTIPVTFKVSKGEYFNNELHMEKYGKKRWFRFIMELRPLIIPVLNFISRLKKENPIIIYEKIKA